MPEKSYSIADTWKHRRPERVLFFVICLVVTVGYALVVMRKTEPASVNSGEIIPLSVYLLCMGLVHMALILFKFRGDPLLPSAVFFVCGIGLLAQFRLGSVDRIAIENHSLLSFFTGVTLMLIVLLIFRKGRYRMIEPLAIPSILAATALLGTIVVLGQRYRGAMFLTGYTNPAEFVKILMIIFLAGFLVQRQKEFKKHTAVGLPKLTPTTIILLVLSWGLPMLLLLIQRDLGMIVMLNAVLIVMLYVATGRTAYLSAGFILAVVFCIAVYALTAHGRARFIAWLNPFSDPTGKSWQILQALSAMYSGGLWGLGLGGGSPQYIPIASSDLIYAVIGEEIGFIGCGIVVLFYLGLLFRGFQIASQKTQLFARLLATGIVTTLAFQTLLNIAGVTKALPLTGITLPFISHGGSSLITTFISVGLLLAISEKEPKLSKQPAAGINQKKRSRKDRPPEDAG